MKRLINIVLVLVTAISLVYSMPSETTTARSTPPIGDSIKKLTNQLMEINATSSDVVTFDTRTPPKRKQQQKFKNKIDMENSHAGIAIPMDEEALEIEDTTKKFNFYKIEKPTTNSGLSTWILLSGQNFLTTISPKKSTVKSSDEEKKTSEQENQNLTVVVTENPNRIIKPIFKKRTTTRKPTTPKTVTTTTLKTTTKNSKEAIKLTKVKASVLNSAVNKKINATDVNNSTATTTKKQTGTSTTQKIFNAGTTTTQKIFNAGTTTTQKITNVSSTTQRSVLKESSTENSTINSIDSNVLQVEAKDEEFDLTNTTDTKKKKTTPKRKKNKNRRRKPATEKLDSNSTKIEKQNKISKEKPIGTQLYNYLSREIMPTVGVGLVSLMVTAGLAGYFLYPFGPARRSYDVDRKDKEGSYYYNDEYSGAIAEEEAIGKVIAGMPANSFYGNTYKTPTSRNTYPNMRYRQVDQHRPQYQPQGPQSIVKGSVEDVQLTPKQQTQPSFEGASQQNYEDSYMASDNYHTDPYQPITYNTDIMEQNKETSYDVDDRQFVVGSFPKMPQDIVEEATPAAVPEHGPRSLKIRKRRMTNDIDNEISSNFTENSEGENTETTTYREITSGKPEVTTLKMDTTTTERLPEKYESFFNLMKDLLRLKMQLGLQLIQNATQTISKYVSKVQTRLDEHYTNYTKSRH